VAIGINGVNQASGWTVNDTTGIVTFAVAPTDTHPISAGFEFDNHVRFSKENDDLLKIQAVDVNQFLIPAIHLEEVKESLALDDEPSLRGARYETIASDISISFAQALFWNINSSSGADVLLEDESNLPVGGPYFHIRRDGGSAFAIKNSLGSSIIGSVDDGAVYTAYIGLNSSLVKQWYISS
jgi:hypothetical protein